MTLPGGGVYHASKYAVEALSDALRFETRGFGIAVSVVAPGPVRTAFARSRDRCPEGDGPYAGLHARRRRSATLPPTTVPTPAASSSPSPSRT